MTNIVHIAYGNLISKPNKFGIEAYIKDGVKTILKDRKVIKTITKEKVFDDQVELIHINNYKNNEQIGTELLRKDYDENGSLLSTIFTKHNDSSNSVNIFTRDENGKFIQLKQSVDEFIQDFLKYFGGKD